MRRRDRILVRANVVWTAFVWIVFVRNLAGDPTQTSGFKVVHFSIAAVSLTFAAALWVITLRSRRRDLGYH